VTSSTASVAGLDDVAAGLKLASQPDFTAAARTTAAIVEPSSIGRAGSRQLHHAVLTNKYRASKSGLAVTIGGPSGDGQWAVGAQYGSKMNAATGKQNYPQFPEFVKQGYTVEPAMTDNEVRIVEVFGDAILKQIT
jgi:hypothetical protein